MSASAQKKTTKKTPAKAKSQKNSRAAKPANDAKANTTRVKKPAAAKRTGTPNKKSTASAKAAPKKKAAPNEAPDAQGQPFDVGSAIGQVAFLMMQSPPHKHMFLTDLEWLVVPPIMLSQIRVFRRDERPFAVASWAYLSEDVEKRLMSGQHRLSPAEWKSGDKLWLIDFIAPFGGEDEILKVLSKQVFDGKPFKAIRPAQDGNGVQVVDVGTRSEDN